MPEADPAVLADEIIGFQVDSDEQRLAFLGKLQQRLGTQPAPLDFRVGTQAEKFLDMEQLRCKALGTFGDLAHYTKKATVAFLGAESDVRQINEATVEGYYKHLRGSQQAPIVQRKVWSYFRRFVRYLWAAGRIELPRNLDWKTFTFEVGAKRIKTYPIEMVREMLGKLNDRRKLYALLALNTGMLGVDMAMLRHEEYQNGRIRRKRSKTRKGENVPEVDYLLWPETVRLLGQYPSQHPEYVLTSSVGTPLWSRRDNGGTGRTDLVGQQWRSGSYKPPMALKALRSVAATILESHREFGRYKSHFLGHSPRSLGDRHYAAPSRGLFDEVLLWLRGQILGVQA
jgi:hypothetical protein